MLAFRALVRGTAANFATEFGDRFRSYGIDGYEIRVGDGGHVAILAGEAERLLEGVYANANNMCSFVFRYTTFKMPQ